MYIPTAVPLGTFWTACPGCKMQYHYGRQYQNCRLQCPKCKEAFLARDIHSTALETLLKLRKPGPTKLKSKKQNRDDEDLSDDDPIDYEQSMQDDQASPALPGRRPSGAKKNSPTRTVDIRDNSDLDNFSVAKRCKIGGGAKGKSGANDSNHAGVGANSTEELDGRKHGKDKNGGDQDESAKKYPHRKSPETFWTACSSCKMQYQYLQQYQNYQIRCEGCKEYFLALDIESSAPSYGAGRFGLHVDPIRQDFRSNKQPESVALNGGLRGLNSFPNHAGSAAFVSSAAAAFSAWVEAAAGAAFSTVPPKNLAADVAPETFVKVKREKVEAEEDVNRKEAEIKRKEEEVERKEVQATLKEAELKRKEDKLEKKEEELERKAKEIVRKGGELRKLQDSLKEEKDVRGKALEAARSWEAVERLVAKHKQQEMARDPGKRTVNVQAGRTFKIRKNFRELESDEDL